MYFQRQLRPIENDAMVIQHIATKQHVLLALFEDGPDFDRW